MRERAVGDQRVEGGEGGEVPGVVARERGGVQAERELGDGRALVDRDRRPQLHRHPPSERCLEAQAGRGLGGPPRCVVAPLRLVAPVDRDRHLPLALDVQPRQRGFRLVGRLHDRVEERSNSLVEHHVARDDAFEAVGARVVEPVDREGVAQERGGTTAHDRHPRQHRDESPAPRAAGSGRADAGSSTMGDSEPSKSTNSAARAGSSTNGWSARGMATLRPGARLRGADDDEAVGVGRAIGRIGGIRLRGRATTDAVRRKQLSFTLEPGDALDRDALALVGEVGGILHVVVLLARSVSVRVWARPGTPDAL